MIEKKNPTNKLSSYPLVVKIAKMALVDSGSPNLRIKRKSVIPKEWISKFKTAEIILGLIGKKSVKKVLRKDLIDKYNISEGSLDEPAIYDIAMGEESNRNLILESYGKDGEILQEVIVEIFDGQFRDFLG